MEKQDRTCACMVCGELRLESDIKVLKKDVSEANGAPHGTMFINVRYCGDKQECHDVASEVRV